jgi:hypothetical protein
MANDPGADSFLAEQYGKMLSALDKVSDPNKAAVLRGQSGVFTDTQKSPQINVPSWNGIIRTGPRPIVSDADWATQRAFERAGQPSPLSAELQAEIGRRRDLARNIPQSATPEYMAGLSQFVNASDNVQDFLATLAVAGRLALGGAELGLIAAGRIIPAFGPTAAAIAARVGARFLPVIGWTLLAADILNLITRLGVWAGPFYGLACGGPRDGLAAAAVPFMAAGFFRGLGRILPRRMGVPALRASKGNKASLGRTAARMPGGRFARPGAGGRYGPLSVSFADAITAAQVGADMAGYGVSLGGIIGAMSDTAFSTSRGGGLSAPGLRSPKVNHDYLELIGPRLRGLSDAALWHRQLAARTLATVPLLLAEPEIIGDELYILSWIAAYTAIEPVQWDQQGLPWRELVANAKGAHWFGWPVRDAGSRETVQLYGQNPDALNPWPLRGAPLEITPAHYLDELAPKIARGLERWTMAAPEDPLRAFVAELTGAYTERAWCWLEGGQHSPEWKLSPDVGVLESLLRANVWPVMSDPPERLVAAWIESRELLRQEERGWLTLDELDAIWTRQDVPLLRLLPPDAPLDPRWFLPFDEHTGQPGDMVAAPSLEQARLWAAELQHGQEMELPPSS